jgi:FixJ family two-component response regulator
VRNRKGVWTICVDLTLPGSLLQGPELITELRVRGVTAPIVIVTEDVSPKLRGQTPRKPDFSGLS